MEDAVQQLTYLQEYLSGAISNPKKSGMKIILSIILTALLSFLFCLYLPWWFIAPAAFLVALVNRQSPGKSFISAFVALFLLWGGLAWYISSQNENLLAHKISMLVIKTDNPFLLILLTALLGAIVASFAALTAAFLRPRK